MDRGRKIKLMEVHNMRYTDGACVTFFIRYGTNTDIIMNVNDGKNSQGFEMPIEFLRRILDHAK
jgi:hypothetical protein